MLLTLTLPHDFGQPLCSSLGVVRSAFSTLLSGRAWMEDKSQFGLAHWIRAHDITVGSNGWHPHIHMLLLGKHPLDDTEMSELEERLYYRWMAAVCSEGHRPPTRAHGIQLERARRQGDVARYITQVVSGTEEKAIPVSLEVARGDLKTSSKNGHRTPWQILADITSTGSEADRRLWREYENATYRVQAIRWSNGLRKDIGMMQEQTDEEIVAEEIGGETVYTFRDFEWFRVCRIPGAQAEVLRVAEEEDATSIKRWITSLGKGRSDTRSRTKWAFLARDRLQGLPYGAFQTGMSRHVYPRQPGGRYDED